MKTNFTINNPLPPLWLMYPHISPCSIGWRMGDGETYQWMFNDWFETLSVEEAFTYQQLFPAPKLWRKYYSKDENGIEVETLFSNTIPSSGKPADNQ